MSDVNRQWYYSINGLNNGPVPAEQVRALAAAGTINADTLVWASPMTEWLPLGRTELARPLAASPPVFVPQPAAAPARGFTPGPGPAMGGAAAMAEPAPDFMGAVRTCLSKYVTFAGRAGRPEFWWFFLFSIIVMVVATIIDSFVNRGGIPVVQSLASLALFLPQLSVAVRRLHDTDRSGWAYFIILIPIVGIILLIMWFCQPGTPGQNRFG